MPEIDGIQLCRQIKRTTDVPFLIYTSKGSEEVASAAFEAGVDDYIRKEPELSHYQVLAKRIRQAAEKHLIESLYRVSIDDNRDGFAIIQGLNFVFANMAMANMLGLQRPEDLIGKSILTWVTSMERDMVRNRTLNRQRGGEEPKLYEYRIKREDGEIRTLEASVSLVNFRGAPASIVFNHDVTMRKKDEELIRESEQKYRGLFENIQELVTLFEVMRDENGEIFDRRLLDCNPAFLETANVKTIDEVRGKTWSQIFNEDDALRNLSSIRTALSTGKSVTFESSRKDVAKSYLTTITPIGKDCYLATGRDITDLKTAEKKLETVTDKLHEYAAQLDEMVKERAEKLRTNKD
jgi:PAS domain S-box-containing protein